MNRKPERDDIRIVRAIVGTLRTHDLSGFEIWQWLGPVRGAFGILTEANLYPTLYGLEAEGLIEGAWHEDDRTRRTYRITAAGMQYAEKEGWGPVAFRRSRGSGALADADGADGNWSWLADTRIRPADEESPAGSPESAAVGAYLGRLQDSLHLSIVYCTDVRHEIADHIADSTARLRVGSGESPDAATATLEALGPAEDLAGHIDAAQLTTERLRSGLWWGSAVGTLTVMVGGALASAGLLWSTPFIASALPVVAGALGLHLYAPFTAEWGTEALALAGWVGAFVGARRSMPHVALKSRRAESYVWRIWAIAGGLPLAASAILVSLSLDPLAAATLLGIPIAWVLGTRRPAPLYGQTVTNRGLAICLAVLAVVLLLPGGRVWAFDPSVIPSADPPVTHDQTATVNWDGSGTSARWQVQIALPIGAGWHDARLELWPTHRVGPTIVLDSSATAPTQAVAAGDFLDFTALPRGTPDWWVTVTAVGPDGNRHTLDTEVIYGRPAHVNASILLWLIGRL
jgi:DNA-binding PadR family transcriptional regulator